MKQTIRLLMLLSSFLLGTVYGNNSEKTAGNRRPPTPVNFADDERTDYINYLLQVEEIFYNSSNKNLEQWIQDLVTHQQILKELIENTSLITVQPTIYRDIFYWLFSFNYKLISVANVYNNLAQTSIDQLINPAITLDAQDLIDIQRLVTIGILLQKVFPELHPTLWDEIAPKLQILQTQ